MADYSLIVGLPVLVLGVLLIIYVYALRSKHHFTSRLTCPKCSRSFDYKWIPAASFTAVRLGRERYLRCPLCHGWSTFNIMETRIGRNEDSDGYTPTAPRPSV